MLVLSLSLSLSLSLCAFILFQLMLTLSSCLRLLRLLRLLLFPLIIAGCAVHSGRAVQWPVLRSSRAHWLHRQEGHPYG